MAGEDSTGKSPDAYRTIGEASQAIGVPQHVLRFWETRFTQIRPVKRAGNRRYYRPADIALLKKIRELLHDEGYSIRGVQRLLRSSGVKGVLEGARDGAHAAEAMDGSGDAAAGSAPGDERELREILGELQEIRDLLR